MNVLLLSNHVNAGGITTYLLTLSTGLMSGGHRIFIASSGGEREGRFTEKGCISVRVPLNTKCEINLFKLIPSLAILRNAVREYQIDVIHSNTRVTQVAGCILSRLTKKPHVTTWHGFFNPRLSRRLFPCWANRIIAISDQVRAHLIRDFSADGERVRLVHNGIDTENLKLRQGMTRSQVRESLGVGNGPLIGVIGRLSEVKGQEFAILAMVDVLRQVPEAELLLVGEGRSEQKLKKLVAEHNLEKKVFFRRAVSNVREALFAIDLFVMPSLQEGLGLSLMEAMAWGKPVIGSAVGGIRTLIADQETGILVPPGDASSLARAIIELLTHPEKGLFLGDKARKLITGRFSAREMTRLTEEVYRECVRDQD